MSNNICCQSPCVCPSLDLFVIEALNGRSEVWHTDRGEPSDGDMTSVSHKHYPLRNYHWAQALTRAILPHSKTVTSTHLVSDLWTNCF